jgi:hypothetical protein
MADKVKIKARKSFRGVEGMWIKGEEKTVEKGRAHSLIAKGLAEEVTDGAVKKAAAHETKPAPAPKTPGDKKPGAKPQRIPASRTAPPLRTKAEGGSGDGPPVSEGQGGSEAASEGVQSGGELITVEGTVITVRAHRHGEGDDAFDVPAGEITGEPDQVYSVFGFRDGSAPIGATGEGVAEVLDKSPGAVLLDVVRIPAASGNADAADSSPSTGSAASPSSSQAAPRRSSPAKASAKPKPGKAKPSK